MACPHAFRRTRIQDVEDGIQGLAANAIVYESEEGRRVHWLSMVDRGNSAALLSDIDINDLGSQVDVIFNVSRA